MKSDINKAIENISYNHHNQSSEVDLGYFDKLSNRKTVYTYTATGAKLKTEIYSGTTLKSTTEYSGAFVYEDNKLSYINIPGGRIVNNQSSINDYQYNLTDHLGNVRVTFTKNETTGDAEIIQEDHYYPFGMRMNGQHYTNTELLNKFLYNGKELQEQTNYYDYGFRQLDPQLGRWHVIDAMAESYFSTSPYAYTRNDPVNRIDVMGLWDEYDDDWYMVDQDGDGRPDEGVVPFYDPERTGHQDGLVWEGEIENFDDIYLDEVVIEGEFDWELVMESFAEGCERAQDEIERLDDRNQENKERFDKQNRQESKNIRKAMNLLNNLKGSMKESEDLESKIRSPKFWAKVTGITIWNIFEFFMLPMIGPDPANLMEQNMPYRNNGQYNL